MSRRRYRYSSYAEMMQTPAERWRLIILASVLLHLLIFFTVTVDLSAPVKKPVHRDIKLILQTASIKQQKPSTPSLAMTKPTPTVVQTVKPTFVSKVTPKVTKPIKTVPSKTSTVAKNRYIKAPPVKPTQVAKVPVAKMPEVPRSVGIPVQAPTIAQQAPQSNIPDDLSHLPSIGVPVIAAPPMTPKPTPLATKPAPVKQQTTLAKVVATPVKPKPETPKPIKPSQPIKPEPIEQADLENVESQQIPVEAVENREVANNTEVEALEPVEKEQPQLQDVETHQVEVEKVEAHQMQHHTKVEDVSLAQVPLEPIESSNVKTERIYPTLINNLLELINAFVPLTEIMPQLAEPEEKPEAVEAAPTPEVTVNRNIMSTDAVVQRPVDTGVEHSVDAEPNVGKEEKIPEQFLSNNWQRATKQSVEGSTAKQLATVEQDEKLARIRFKEHKDYGDIPDVPPDNTAKSKSKKSKSLDLGVHVGDCFIGYKGDKAEKAHQSSIDCEF